MTETLGAVLSTIAELIEGIQFFRELCIRTMLEGLDLYRLIYWDKMEEDRRIVYGILEFLNTEFHRPSTSADSKESLEVAMQCLETAFGINLQHTQYKGRKTIRELVVDDEEAAEAEGATAGAGEGTNVGDTASAGPGLNIDLGLPYELPREATEEEKVTGEDFKNKGNDAMKSMNYSEALGHYNRAVELDGRNSVFFCNRAAAFIKLEDYNQALRDCQIALRLQPNYARAFGRMGVTYSHQNKHVEAILCYRKAAQLDPNNDSYTSNLRYSQSVVMAEVQQTPGSGGGPNFQNIFNNPSLINMASQMLEDPSMQQMLSTIMGGLRQPDAPNAPVNPMENLMQMGQAIANQIRTANPELAEQLGVGRHGQPPGNGGNNGNLNPES